MQVSSTDETTAVDTTPPDNAALSRLVSAGILGALCLVLIGLWLLIVSGETWSALAVFVASLACGGLAYIAWQEGAAQRGETLAQAGEVDFHLLWRLLVRHREFVFVSAITAVAAVLRLWALDSLPPGLHGDEGWTGIDAQRILREGWIGPYVGSALGQPTGPLYWVAAVLKITGDSVYAVRFSLAILGIATIPLTYVAARLMFDRTTGVIAALFLAFLAWHIHFSRIAFMVITWPLFEVAITALLFLGFKKNKSIYFVLAGIALGVGIYTYNVFPVFAVAVGVFLILALLQRKVSLTRQVRQYVLLGVCAAVVALPMFLYVVDPGKDYFSHHRAYSYLSSDEFEDATASEKAELLLDRWQDWVLSMVKEAKPDGVDGAGSTPIVHWSTGVLVLGGLVYCIWTIRKSESQFLLLMFLIIPVAALVTISGSFRRTLGLAPYVAILAAVPLAKAWLAAEASGSLRRWSARGAIVIAVLAVMWFNYDQYFNKTAESPAMRFAFPVEITKASEYVADLPGNPYVYFYSDRWSFNYETRQYLASSRVGEDRSTKFGRRQDFEIDRNSDSVFVLLDPYMGQIGDLKNAHPNGREFHGRADDRTIFIAYYLPAESRDVAPRPDADVVRTEQDSIRRAELQTLHEALSAYWIENGFYPSTDGKVQSACVYHSIDKLCVLEPQLGSDVFLDPRNDPDHYGYWYKSDGITFTLFASMESAVTPSDTCPPEEHLRRVANVLCLRSIAQP